MEGYFIIFDNHVTTIHSYEQIRRIFKTIFVMQKQRIRINGAIEGEDVVLNGKRLTKNVYIVDRDLITIKHNGLMTHIYYVEKPENRKCSYIKNNGIIIGRGEKSNICIKHSSVFEEQVSISSNGLLKVERNSYTFVNSLFCDSEQQLKIGDRVQILDTIIYYFQDYLLVMGECQFENCEQYLLKEENSDFGTITEFSQSPRIYRSINRAEIKIDPPPALSQNKPIPFLLAAGPSITMSLAMLVSTAVGLGNVVNNGVNGTVITSSIMALSMLAGALLWPLLLRRYQAEQEEKQQNLRETKYKTYLNEKEARIKSIYDANKNVIDKYLSPSVDRLLSAFEIDSLPRFLWERGINDEDALSVRLGDDINNIIESGLSIRIAEPHFSLVEDPLSKRMEEIAEEYAYYEQGPINISLKDNRIIGLFGNSVFVETILDTLICNLMLLYHFENVKTVFLFPDSRKSANHIMLSEIPHVWSNTKDMRYVSDSPEETEKLIIQIFNRLNMLQDLDKNEHKEYFVVFVWDKQTVEKSSLYQAVIENPLQYPVTFIFIANTYDALPKDCSAVVQCSKANYGIYEKNKNENKVIPFTPSKINIQKLQEVVRKINGIHIQAEYGQKNIPKNVSFLDMFKVGSVEELDIGYRWESSNSHNSLTTPIGVIEGGSVLSFDIHEAADGCHGIVAGTTGSGKSEFLQSYILSLMTNYSPEDVSFVLVDFKGGDIATPFLATPHLSAVVSNLSKSTLYRAMISLEAEKIRRQELFNAKKQELGKDKIDINSYQAMYHEGIVTEPLPHLIIIIDEFAQFKTQHSEYMQKMIDIAQIGRSLGIHLLLATQKPAGVVDGQIWSNSRFKFCLKVMEREDSRAVLQRDEAAFIKTPGTGYMQIGYNEKFNMFQSGYSRAKYIPAKQYYNKEDITVRMIDTAGNTLAEEADIDIPVNTDITNQITAVVREINRVSEQKGYLQKHLWYPELPKYVYTDECTEEEAGAFAVSVGLMDIPALQLQKWYIHNFVQAGNIAIYGAAGKGKTTFVQSVLYQAVTKFTPEQFKYAIIDLGSKNYEPFINTEYSFDHVVDADRLENVLDKLAQEMSYRKQIMAAAGCSSFDAFTKSCPNQLPLMVVVVENYVRFREAAYSCEETLIDMVSGGQTYGIFFMITTNSKSGIYYKVQEQINTVIVLNMLDAEAYRDILGVKNEVELENVKGRAFILYEGKPVEMQVALPVHDENEIIRMQVIKERMQCYATDSKIKETDYTAVEPAWNMEHPQTKHQVEVKGSVILNSEPYSEKALFVGNSSLLYQPIYINSDKHKRVMVCVQEMEKASVICKQITNSLGEHLEWNLNEHIDDFIDTLKSIKQHDLLGEVCVVIVEDFVKLYKELSTEECNTFNLFLKNYPNIIYITFVELASAHEHLVTGLYGQLCKNADIALKQGGAIFAGSVSMLGENADSVDKHILEKRLPDNQFLVLRGCAYHITGFELEE